jgi:cobalt-zinc-cadmium efflux system protein
MQEENSRHDHHHHPQSPTAIGKLFAIGVALNVLYIIIEAAYGLIIHSMALLSDAGHNLSDVLGLLLSWGAIYLATKRPTKSRTYGYRKSSILAAFLNAVMLFIVIGAIAIEAIQRLTSQTKVDGWTMIIVAGIGVLINGITALFFIRESSHDLNIKGVFLHMAADAAVSVGVVISGIIILYTKLYWIDSVMSLIIVVVIFIGTWRLFKDSLDLILDSVPADIDTSAVEKYLLSLPSVESVHDLHIWAMSSSQNALTVHLVRNAKTVDDKFTQSVADELLKNFHIHHTTIQYETGNVQDCGHDCL